MGLFFKEFSREKHYPGLLFSSPKNRIDVLKCHDSFLYILRILPKQESIKVGCVCVLTAVGHPQIVVGCWLDTSIPSHLDLSIGQLTVWWVNPFRVSECENRRVPKMETTVFL